MPMVNLNLAGPHTLAAIWRPAGLAVRGAQSWKMPISSFVKTQRETLDRDNSSGCWATRFDQNAPGRKWRGHRAGGGNLVSPGWDAGQLSAAVAVI